MNVVAASRPRCLAVAAGLTAAGWGAAAVLVRAVATTSGPAAPDDALARLCSAALLVAVGWAWLQAMAGVADAWRGAGSGVPSFVRRLALTACGAAAVTALVSPAAHATPEGPRPDPLVGLPLPERAVGPAQRPVDLVVVEAGDSLWALAAADLGPGATGREISARWHAVYRRNRAVVGADPDLILPGQILLLPHRTKEHTT